MTTLSLSWSRMHSSRARTSRNHHHHYQQQWPAPLVKCVATATTKMSPSSSTTPPPSQEVTENTTGSSSSSSIRSSRRLKTARLFGRTLPHDNHGKSSNQNKTCNKQQQLSVADDDENNNNRVASSSGTRIIPSSQPAAGTHGTFLDWMQQFRQCCGHTVNHARTQLCIVVLIAINSIMMGMETYSIVQDHARVRRAFDLVDGIFLIIFTVELALQFIYMGWKLVLDGWLVFDLIVIVTSWSFQQVQIIRAFRIFRALRLITRVKVMKNLVVAIFGVVPRMFAIGGLLFLVSYIFAVMFTQLFSTLYEDGLTDEDYFGRMDDTFFTLFQMMTLDSWADICRQVMAVYSWAWIPIVAFVIVTAFVVVNLIIAVICDAISALHDDEKAKLHGTFEEGAVALDYDDDDDNNNKNHTRLDDTSGPIVRKTEEEILREQLDVLEDQVEALTRMQAETMATVQALTLYIQQKQKAT